MEKRTFTHQGSEACWRTVEPLLDEELNIPTDRARLLDVAQTGLGIALASLSLASNEYGDLLRQGDAGKVENLRRRIVACFGELGNMIDEDYQ